LSMPWHMMSVLEFGADYLNANAAA